MRIKTFFQLCCGFLLIPAFAVCQVQRIQKIEKAPPQSFRVVLEPIQRTTYFPQVQAIAPVMKLDLRPGDSFKKGDLILQLDPDKFKAFYQKSLAALEKAKTELNTKERLYKDKNGSFFDYIEAIYNVANAEAEVVFAKKNLEATSIYAPYDGRVASLNIQPHELPVEGKDMITLIEDDILIGKILVPSNWINSIHIGDPVAVTIDETGDTVPATIKRISAVIDPASSTLEVQVQIDNAKGKLKAGMSGSAVFEKQSNP